MNKEKRITFAKNLIALMEHHHITVREAAKLAGVPLSTIQNWRSGSSPNDYNAVRRLANALKMTLTQLLTGEDDDLEGEKKEDVFTGNAYITIHKLLPEKKISTKTSKPKSSVKTQKG